MKKILLVLNDPPYGTERSYNGLRLALALASRPGAAVRAFLVGDGAACARAGQRVPEGYYNLAEMLESLAAKGAEIGVCGTCMDARGLDDASLVTGARRSSLGEFATWTLEADQVLTF